METPNPIPAAKKAFNVNGVITFVVAFIIVNALLDIVGNFFPIVPVFITKPVTTVRALFASKTAAAK